MVDCSASTNNDDDDNEEKKNGWVWFTVIFLKFLFEIYPLNSFAIYSYFMLQQLVCSCSAIQMQILIEFDFNSACFFLQQCNRSFLKEMSDTFFNFGWLLKLKERSFFGFIEYKTVWFCVWKRTKLMLQKGFRVYLSRVIRMKNPLRKRSNRITTFIILC